MWIKSHSKVYQGVNKDEIWRIMTDINNWSTWHGDLDSCTLQGEFKLGNYFMLKPKGARPVKIELTEIVEGHKFTDCTKFPGAKMYDTHEIEEISDGVRLSNKLVVTGLLKYLWIKLVAQHVADSVPAEMDALINLARSKRA